MTARGRKPDPDQAAKGFPNRRKSATQKREAEAQRIAALLAQPLSADPLALPPLLDQGPLYAAAIAVWRELAPRLAGTHRLAPQHRPIFAQFCVYYAEWVTLNDQLTREGSTQRVKTVVGGFMIRDHPAVRQRERAFDNCMKLSGVFGLTPHDEYDLFARQMAAAANNPGLFGARQPEQQKPDVPAPADNLPRAGILAQMNSAPPDTTH